MLFQVVGNDQSYVQRRGCGLGAYQGVCGHHRPNRLLLRLLAMLETDRVGRYACAPVPY